MSKFSQVIKMISFDGNKVMSYSKGMVIYLSKYQIQLYLIIIKCRNCTTVFWNIETLFNKISEFTSYMVVSFFYEIDKFYLSPVLG